MSSSLKLRDYQIEALYSMIEAAKRIRGRERGPAELALAIQPTGAGKTVLMLSFARGVRKHWGWRTLIIVPFTKLLYQTAEKIKEKLPELTYGLIGDGHFDLEGDVVIAIQASLNESRLKQIPRDMFEVVICDEAHHAAADSYRIILDHFAESKIIIGMTATYIRGDDVSIASDQFFPNVIVWNTIGQLTRAGYLVEAYGYYKYTDVSLENVKVRGGNFVERQLSRAVNTPERNNLAVDAWIEFMEGRPTPAFCVDVQHARDMAECFNSRGIPAAAVWGDMPDQEYDRIMGDYEAGRILILPNAKLLTEGWDAPWTSGVLMACPTTKRAAYVKVPQQIGRMLRPHPESGKVDGVVVELRDRGNVAQSGIAAIARTPEKYVQSRVPLHEQASRSNAMLAWSERGKLLEELSSADLVEERFNIIERLSRVSAYAWVPLGKTLYMPLSDDDFIEIVEETPWCYEIRICAGGELEIAGSAPSRERALQMADSWLNLHAPNKTLLLNDQAWRRRNPSEKQLNYAHSLTKLPISLLEGLSCGQVSDLIKSARALLVQPLLVDDESSITSPPTNQQRPFTPHAWQLQA